MAPSEAIKSKRLLVVAPEPFYEDRGTPIALRAVLEAATASGFSVDLLTYPLGESPAITGVRYIRVANLLKFRSVPIGFSWKKVWLDVFLFFALRRLLRQQRYECVQALEEAGFLAVFAAMGTGHAVLYDMQSSLPEQLSQLPVFRNPLVKPLLQACERWLIRKADFTVSSAGLEAKVRKGMPNARIRDWKYPSSFVPPSIEDVASLRAQLNIAKTDRVVLYSGSFADYQGLPLLIDAMPDIAAAVPNAVLVLVGALTEDEQRARKALSLILPDHRYRIIRRLPKHQVASYLSLADILVSPRKEDSSNLPLKILEYLAAGKPIVATATHAHRATLTQELAVLVQPEAKALAKAVISLLSDTRKTEALKEASTRYARNQLGMLHFSRFAAALYEDAQLARRRMRLGLTEEALSVPAIERASIVIPAKNTGPFIRRVIDSVRAQQTQLKELEVIVVDDGSADDTAGIARQASARVISRAAGKCGNPAAARNAGAAAATGGVLVFLDADCVPAPGWLAALLRAHEDGAVCVGGSLALPLGLPISARWDYYCGWYHMHERRAAGRVSQHPPCNLSIVRSAFTATSGFNESPSICYSHEELSWQSQFQKTGGVICFEPKAMAYHYNRPGLANLLKRNYRWAYSAIESKHGAGITRFAWAYNHPLLLSVLSLLMSPLSSIYITACWLRAGIIEPLVAFPVIFLTRLVYGFGACFGGLAWLKRRRSKPSGVALGTELV